MTTTETCPLLRFIDAAAAVTQIPAETIHRPAQKQRKVMGSEKYFLACRLRWLACVYAEEHGMTKGQIKRSGIPDSVPYRAQDEMGALMFDKPLCRILRDIMAKLTPISAPVTEGQIP